MRNPLLRSHVNIRCCPISTPFCLINFASSPTRIEVWLAVTESAKRTLGLSSSIFAVRALFFSRSSLRAVNAAIAKSGLPSSSSVAYNPCLRIAGRTSDVTQCLNCLAFGSLLERIRLYKPDSLMSQLPRWPNSGAFCPWVFELTRSSSSTWSKIACLTSAYPRTSATSLPTKYGLSSIVSVRTVPNSEFSKTVMLFVFIVFHSSKIYDYV